MIPPFITKADYTQHVFMTPFIPGSHHHSEQIKKSNYVMTFPAKSPRHYIGARYPPEMWYLGAPVVNPPRCYGDRSLNMGPINLEVRACRIQRVTMSSKVQAHC